MNDKQKLGYMALGAGILAVEYHYRSIYHTGELHRWHRPATVVFDKGLP